MANWFGTYVVIDTVYKLHDELHWKSHGRSNYLHPLKSLCFQVLKIIAC